MFRMNIGTDNAAFTDGNRNNEIARILRDVASQIAAGKDFGSTVDINGNSVGQFNIGRGFLSKKGKARLEKATTA
jgi:hypothetical protein